MMLNKVLINCGPKDNLFFCLLTEWKCFGRMESILLSSLSVHALVISIQWTWSSFVAFLLFQDGREMLSPLATKLQFSFYWWYHFKLVLTVLARIHWDLFHQIGGLKMMKRVFLSLKLISFCHIFLFSLHTGRA